MTTDPQAPGLAMVNGRLTPGADAVVSIRDRGFRYGDGVFETIAVPGGVPYQFSWHMRRLAAGLESARIAFDTVPLQGWCRTVLHENGMSDGVLRIQVTRGIGGRGYLPDPAHAPTCVIEALPPPPPPSEPALLWRTDIPKIPARYKLCQGLNSTLARLDAADHGCFEALLLNERGELCEAGSGNLFWIKDSVLYTPHLDCGALEGSTRAAVLRLSPYPVREVRAGIEALAEAEAVFLTNVGWTALAVGALEPDGLRWDSVKTAHRLRALILQDREEYCRKHGREWA